VSVLSIDPGSEKSALLHLDGKDIPLAVIEPNEAILKRLEEWPTDKPVTLVIEWVESYGTIVGQSVFDTVFWVGRFAQIFGYDDVRRVTRGIVKMHICGTKRAGDSDVRTMIIQRFGGTDKAIGKKRSQGPLFNITSHLWAALGLALTWHDQNEPQAVKGAKKPAENPPADFSHADDFDGSEEVDASVDTEDITVDAGELEGW
jgi:hypothetical protein